MTADLFDLEVNSDNNIIEQETIKVAGKLDYYKLIKYSPDKTYNVNFALKIQLVRK
jgi:hypothetical protein